MTIEYSSAVDIAFQNAIRIAQKAGRPRVEVSDLLHALAADRDGQVFLLLVEAGAEVSGLQELLPPLDAFAIEEGLGASVSYDAAVRDVLSHARSLARVHGAEGTITSDQVLLALMHLSVNDRERLEKIGLDIERLEDVVSPPVAPLVLDDPIDLSTPAETMDVARILDASANRAREGLRVLEDYCRFALDDAFLTSQLKTMRHALAEALEALPADLLLQARATLDDVGTAISTPREQARGSIIEVVRAGAKRLEEALRSLEEFGKIIDPMFAQAIEQLRYQAYTLERAVTLRPAAGTRLAEAQLYVLVTESACRASLVGTVSEVLAGGAQIIQLREKNIGDRALLEKACDLRRLTRAAGALLIINDRPDIAKLAEADGVHLGQDDLPLREARRLLGPDALIGISTHDLEQVRRAVLEGADYLGVGPTFASVTKSFAGLAGLDFVRQATAETSLPVFVLGGVSEVNIAQVLAAGGRRVAVSHAICAADDPRKAAAELRCALAQPGKSSQ